MKERKNVFGTLLTLMLFVSSLFANFAIVAPAVLADNGIGEVTELEVEDGSPEFPVVPPDKAVITVEAEKDIRLKIHNDEPVTQPTSTCIDEIIITFPGTWGGQINTSTSTVSNMGNVVLTNEADDGTFSGLEANSTSLKITPAAVGGLKLCPSATSEIVLKGLVAPSEPEVSLVEVLTSDQDHNEPSNNAVRANIDIEPEIIVSDAEKILLQYLDLAPSDPDSEAPGLAVSAGGAEYEFVASAKGGWGRLLALYLTGSVATTIDVYMDDGDGVFDGGDFLIADNSAVDTTTSTVSIDASGANIIGNVANGFIKDSAQGGSNVKFFIDVVGGASTLTLLGHADEDADQTVDPTYTGTGFTNPPKEGTVLNVESAMNREIHGQLVEADHTNSSIYVYVMENGIPIYYSTTLSSFDNDGPETTDTGGQVEVELLPGTTAGNALVEVCYPDPFCTTEDIAIAPGVAVRKEITQGMDISVEAGSVATIEVTIYDQYGNVISNTPDRPRTTFEILSAPDTDVDLDDNVNPPFNGDGDGFESELANLGIADASLQTSSTIGDHVVEVCVEGPVNDCMITTITGTLGQAGQIDCTVLDENLQPLPAGNEIKADQDFKVLVEVKDANGNPLEKWESLVEVELKELDPNPHGETKIIMGSDLREEKISYTGTKVQGKLNNNQPAMGIVDVGGCEALGQIQVMCRSDTLLDDTEWLDVINSDPTCIDVGVNDYDVCGEQDHLQIDTSVVDTCWNKVVDQECGAGGQAASCVKLETSCGTLSTDKTCVDLNEGGMAPTVDLDISACGCGEIEITATDEPDCCVYDFQTLPMCDFDGDTEPDRVIINNVGPAESIDMEVYPYAPNQEEFWVSEKAIVDLTLRDACGQEVYCEEHPVDVELEGEDCVDDTIQVDSPFTAIGDDVCSFYNEPVHKVVIENCGDGEKEWTDLPEKDDIVVDKIAFEYNGPTADVEVCIYEENEKSAGFQYDGPYGDISWGCMDLDEVPNVPTGDADHEDRGAYDEIHSDARNESAVYYLELDDRISKYQLGEYDNQRMGGAVIEPGDTRDFYLVLNVGDNDQPCGTYDADYLFFQDYNSPDIIKWTPENKYDTHVRDTLEGSELYTWRNDDYIGPDPYPKFASTPSYGFGDRILHNLKIIGNAQVYFRDLVSEMVTIFVDAGLPVNLIDNGFPVDPDNQAKVTFLTQPATQVVAINHGDLEGPEEICDGDGFDHVGDIRKAKLPYMMDYENGNGYHEESCRPALACEGEGYDINLQITDGFQNHVGLGTEVQLHSCLTYPKEISFGRSILSLENDIIVNVWEKLGLHEETSDPWDACFDMATFKEVVKDELEILVGQDDEFLQSFVGSSEFDDFVSSIFDDKNVKFVDVPGYPLGVDPIGHTIVTTDSNGEAIVRVESDDSSLFQISSYDASFRIFFVPHALDADFIDVTFAPGTPAVWDVLAVPETGIPADGEQEAHVLIRKLDACGNPVYVDEEVKVTALSDSGRAIISKDFSKYNNYDNEVVGYLNDRKCSVLMPWFEDCSLEVLNDVMETVTVVVEDAVCEQTGPGVCSGPMGAGCEIFESESECTQPGNELCSWIPGQICQESDSTQIDFVGAPVKLTITEIKHSDLIPADGYKRTRNIELPRDACTDEQVRQCELHGEPEICAHDCVKYGNSGAWVTVEVQDKYMNRVTGYLGDGLKKDPGDRKGKPDYIFENICVSVDDPNAFISDKTFGWMGLEKIESNENGKVYCGDLAYGRGSFKVSYKALSERNLRDEVEEKQPFDPRETEKVIVSVFDVCDSEMFTTNSLVINGKNWDDLCNAQEYNENNLPDSETASRLNPDSNKIIFSPLPDRWDIESDKLVVAADGTDFATLVINTENEFMDIRTSLDATVQSSLLGSKLESEAITPGCYVNGIFDPINPTSINVHTEACSGGRAALRLSSTEPGVARVTVTGNALGCLEYEVSENDQDDIFAVPECEQFGVLPMTPKTIEIEFKQAFTDSIELEEGWNFFSVPNQLHPSNDEWSELGLDVTCSASAYWDEATQSWVSPVPGATFVEPMEGYWCNVASATTVDVTPMDLSGAVFLPPIKAVKAGWNDVGLSSGVEMKMEHALISIDAIYTQVLDWLESLQRYMAVANSGELGGGEVPGTTGTTDMEAGQGYFLWSNEDGSLAGLS